MSTYNLIEAKEECFRMPVTIDPFKLDPLIMKSLKEMAKQVAVPKHDFGCWAAVEVVKARAYWAAEFGSCRNKARGGHLTCLVHYNRELAARELKCRNEKVAMSDIAYTDENDRLKHKKYIYAQIEARRKSRTTN